MHNPSQPPEDSLHAPEDRLHIERWRLKAYIRLIAPVEANYTFRFTAAEPMHGYKDGWAVAFEVPRDDAMWPLCLSAWDRDEGQLREKCEAVVKAGYIKARGEFHIDVFRSGPRAGHCDHYVSIRSIKAFEPWSPPNPK